MRHVKSNVNILKPLQDKLTKNNNNNQNLKSSNSNNIIIKPKTSLIISEHNSHIKSINSQKNFLNNLFDKSTKNSFSSILFNNNNNNINNNSNSNYIKNSISPNKINSFNRKNKTNSNNNIFGSKKLFIKNNKNKENDKGISIRLNFKNKIINNNFSKRNKQNKVKKSIRPNTIKNMNLNSNLYKSDFNVSEKIKEKDKQITLLQKDLLQSQKLLNHLQEEKQKEISSTYNSIKKADSLINYNNINTNYNSININNNNRMKKYYSLNNFFVSKTDKNLNVLRTFYGKSNLILNKSNSKRNIKSTNRIRKKSNLNIYTTNPTSLAKYQIFKNNIQKTNRNCKTRNNIHKNYNYYNYNSGSNSNKKNSKNKNFLRALSFSPNKILAQYLHQYESNCKTAKNTFRKNNFSINKTIKSISPSSAQNRIKNKIMKNVINNKRSKDLDFIINKGEEIKKRMKNLLDNYISLSFQINKKYMKTEI